MASMEPEQVPVELTGELVQWTPPQYHWDAVETHCLGLARALNHVQSEGWEVFQVIPSTTRKKCVIVCRKQVEDESE